MPIGGLPEGGVVLVAKDLQPFLAALDKANTALASLGKTGEELSKNIADSLRGVDKALEDTAKQAEDTGLSMEEFGDICKTVGLALAAVGAAGLAATKQIVGTASRVEELGIILEVVRKNAQQMARAEGDVEKASALTSEAVGNAVETMQELGIAIPIAYETMARLIRYELDWTKASELARLAQDSATYAAQDSSEALEGLIHGITTLQPRVLRTYGIMLNLREAYRDYADANDIATESMTTAQKQQAVLNETLSQAANVAGAYTAAMTTGSKQLRTLLHRDIVELSNEFGESLIPAFDAAVNRARKWAAALKDLPDPVQATIAQMGSFTSGLAALGGVALLLIPRLITLRAEIMKLGLVASVGLGPLSIMLTLLGLATAGILTAYNLAKAQKQQAIETLDATGSYEEYIRALETAEVQQYRVSEAIYDTLQAEKKLKAERSETVDEDYLEDLLRAEEKLDGIVRDLSTSWLIQADAMSGASMDAEWLLSVFEDLLPTLNKAEQDAAKNEELMRRLAVAYGMNAGEAWEFAEALHLLVIATQARADAGNQDTKVMWDEWEVMRALTQETIKLEAARRRDAVALKDYAGALAGYIALSGAARAVASAEISVLEQEYAEDAQDAWDDLWSASEELRDDWLDRQEELDEELLDIDEELAEDLADLWAEYEQERIDLADDLAADLAKSEADLARDLAKLWEDLEIDRADLAREYAQKREDVERDLARDLEDLAEDHARRLEDLEREHQQDLLDLAEDYGAKRASIEEKYAKKRADIEAKYQAQGLDIEAERKRLLDELREVQAGREISPFSVGLATREGDIKQRLDELKQMELDALEAEKQAELDALAEWLTREEQVREEAYQQEQAEEQRRYEERQADRMEQYDDRLEDLQYQQQREWDELQRNYERRKEELIRRNQEERAEILRRYDERLADLEAQQIEEAQRLEDQATKEKERLADLRDAEQTNYEERQQALKDHYFEQLKKAKDHFEDEKDEIEAGLEVERLTIGRQMSKQSAIFRAAYGEQLDDLWDYLVKLPRSRLKLYEIYQKELEDLWGIDSPSRWMINFGQRLTQGLDAGLDMTGSQQRLQDALTSIQEGLSGLMTATGNEDLVVGVDADIAAVETALAGLEAPSLTATIGGDVAGFPAASQATNLQDAIASFDSGLLSALQGIASVPPVIGGGPTTNTTTMNLTANYARAQSEASVRDDIAMMNMVLQAMPRR